MKCSVEGCKNDAEFEVILYDVYSDGTVFFEQDYTCPYICKEHLMENEQGARGTREPRGHVVYPYSNKHGAQGFTIYRPISQEELGEGSLHGMDSWCQEKSENVLRCLGGIVEVLKRTKDLVEEIEFYLYPALWDATKLFAFAHGAEWSTTDREIILKNGRRGVEEIAKRYHQR